MKKNTLSVFNSGGNLHLLKNSIKAILFIALLFTFSNSFSQTISSTGGSAVCGDCTPPGWSDTGGTPDISDRNNAGGQGTLGGGASWVNSPLPLPPTGDLTWISMRDVGDFNALAEESVSTTMGSLTTGKVYKLTIHFMTSLSNNDGNGEYYSGQYIEQFDYQINSNPRQGITVTTNAQNNWATRNFYFIGQPNGSGEMNVTFYPLDNAITGGNFQNVQVIHFAIQLNALEVLDTDGDGIDDTIDIDDDNDGILDTDETNIGGTQYDPLGDEDGDKLPNYLDVRDDGNGGTGGNTNYTDANGDGIPDVYDNDNDGIPNHLDLDSDNDGIPDNIEAQTTAGYIAPSGSGNLMTDDNNNGLDDNYETAQGGTDISPINTDSATVSDNPDYLDTDSDQDGVSDTIEANLTLSGTVGDNGLDNTYDNGDNYSDVNGAFDNTQTDNFPDDGNNAGSGLPNDVDWRDISVNGELDTDGDGVPNSVDIDDDNDGILDTDEANCNKPASNADSVESSSSVTNAANSIGSDNSRATINTTGDILVIDLGLEVVAGTIIEIEARKTRSGITMDIEESITTSGFTNSQRFSFSSNNTDETKNYTLTSNARYIRITMGTDDNPLFGDGQLLIDNVGYQAFVNCDFIDTDGDGIQDYLDLDSDNDGIPDNIEGQGTTTYIAPTGSVGANGLYDVYENNDTASATSFSIENTDGTDNPDYLDTDSDNDGTDDRTEANLSLSGTVGVNGLDSNYDNGDNYTDTNGSFDSTPYNDFPDNPAGGEIDWRDATSVYIDTDNDGIPDATDLDDDNDGILDTEEGGTNCSGSSITTSVDRLTVNGGGTGTLQNINLSSLGVSIGDQIIVDNVLARGDIDNSGLTEGFTLNFNSGTITSTLLVPGNQCSATLDAVSPAVNQTLTVIDIGSGVPGITIQATTLSGVGNFCDETGGQATADLALEYTVRISCSPSRDTDGDGIPDYKDLDSDNDGIPDNIEAQGTTTYIVPNGVYDAQGVDTAYTGGLTPIDTDQDGTQDYLDTDADDDGILDNVEAGLTLTGNVGTNGLDNAYDNGDNYTDVNGSFDNSQANNFPDADNDVFNGGDVDYRDITFTPDNDGDGINDEVDLDDDNDGIVDSTEYGSCSPTSDIYNWETLYTGNPNGAAATDGDDPVTTDNTKTVNGIEVTLSRTSNVDSGSNYRVNDFVTTNGSYSLVQQASTNANSRHTFRFGTPIYGLGFTIYDVDGASGATIRDNVQIIITKEDGSSYALQAADYTVNGSSNQYDGNNTFSGNNTTGNGNVVINNLPIWVIQMQIVFTNEGTGDIGANQNIAIGNLSFCTPLDSDGDGVFDFRDLDADNDGIPDNIEAQDTQDYIAPSGSYNVNGIDLAYGTGLTPQNTDGTGEADYLDLDSDDDGTNDVLESSLGGALPNNGSTVTGTFGTNGLLDTLDNGDNYVDVNGSFDNTQTDNFTDTDGDVNNNGGDLDYRDTTNGLDTDGDGIVDSIDIDDDNDGILDTVEDAGNNDVDGDGIINSLDIDSDNDGIPDNVEAQPTTTYVAPTGSVGANGLYDVYEGGNDTSSATSFSIENTDGTDNPDYLDTDSDNDGTFDISENHVSDTTDASLDANTGSSSDGTPDGMIDPANFVDTDGDGLADIFEGSDTNDGYDSNDEINSPSTELPDVDSDVNGTGDVDYRDDTVDPIDPGVVGNTLWLRADIGVTGGSSVTLWEDQTTSNADFTGNGTPDNTVTANNLNFNPVVTFVPADNDYLTYTGNLNPRTLYIVYNDTSTQQWTTPFTNDGSVIGHGETDDTGLYNTGFTPAEVRNGSGQVNGLSTTLTTHNRPDNYELISNVFTSNISNSSQVYTLGKDRNGQATTRIINGSIAEIMVFSDEHTGVKRQQIESYLAIKYGFTLSNDTDNDASINETISGLINEGDYILADQGTKVWDSESTYHNDVAGIGRDDAMVLNQKQSKSVNSDAIITIGLTSIAATNAANANTFTTNKDFLMWGNNNGVINTVTETELICAPEKTLGRTWKIVENGSVGSVQVAANKSSIDGALTTPNTIKVLKVADDAAFTTNVSYVPLTDTTINSENVYAANYDFDGTKYFTYSEINGIFWTGSNSSWAGGNGPSNEASTVVADTDKVMVIDAQGTGNHATLTDDAKVECVWVKTDSKLMVADAKYLEFDEDFILDGEVRLIGDGQLIQTHVGASNVQGSGKLYRDQKSQIAVAESIYRYNYWSSPVVELNKDTYRVGEVMKDGTTPTSESSQPRDINFVSNTYNGSTSDPITIANYWIWTFAGGTTRDNWVQQRETGEINRGLGFIMKSTGRIGGQNFTFVGTPNDGSITFNLGANTVSLLGNPYASNIDADEFITTNSEAITGTLYFWEHTGAITQPDFVEGHGKLFYIGGYSQRNLAMGVSANTVVDGTDGIGNLADYHTPSQYISVAQGFFVSTSATGGTVRFENAQRGYSSDTYFFKHPEKQQAKTDKEEAKLPVLKLGFDYYNNNNAIIHRQAGISFKRGNSFKFDYGYDSDAFDVQPTDIYWQFPNEDKKLIIAGVKEIDNQLEIPLSIEIDTDKSTLLMIDEVENIEHQILLEDKVENKTYVLSNGSIELNLAKGSYKDRFYLKFYKQAALNTDDEVLNKDLSIYIDKSIKDLVIMNNNNLTLNKIEIYNVLGQKLNTWSINNNAKETRLSMNSFSSAIYIVKVKTDKGTLSKKIIFQK